MTALSLVYPVQNMINAVAIGFGIGINARVSYHLGAGDKKMADTAATHGFLLSVIHGILMTVISIAVMPAFLRMYTQDETVIRMGLEYSTIRFSVFHSDRHQPVLRKTFPGCRTDESVYDRPAGGMYQ